MSFLTAASVPSCRHATHFGLVGSPTQSGLLMRVSLCSNRQGGPVGHSRSPTQARRAHFLLRGIAQWETQAPPNALDLRPMNYKQKCMNSWPKP